MTVIDALVRGAKGEVQVVKSFVTSPKGVFEAVDDMIKVARTAAFESEASVGLQRPILTGSLAGQRTYGATVGTGNVLRKVKERVQSARTKVQGRIKY